MKIGDVLNLKGREIHCIGAQALVSSAIALLTHHRIGSAAVTNERGGIEGLVTEADLLSFLGRNGPEGMCRPVGSAMRAPAPICTSKDAVIPVVARMTRERHRHLIVMDGERPVGIVSIGDLVKAQLESARLETDVLRDIARAKLLVG